MDPFIIKSGDTAPSLQATLVDESGGPNLSGSVTVRFVMRALNTDGTMGSIKVNAEAEVVDAVAKTVRYNWQDGDLDEDGTFVAEFKVIRDGRTMTYPDKGYIPITINDGLQD